MYRFGEYLKELRLARRLTLRSFARLAARDGASWSEVDILDIEKGRRPAPDRETLEWWAEVLDLNPLERKEFFRFAEKTWSGFVPRKEPEIKGPVLI